MAYATELGIDIRLLWLHAFVLQILGLNKQGHREGMLWSEHKAGSGFSPDQLPGYAKELAVFEERGEPPSSSPS